MLGPAAVNLLGGMIGGSVGVGVAYPLDTLKTRQQAKGDDDDGSGATGFALAVEVLQTEGLSGFYSGVSSTMVGPAIISYQLRKCIHSNQSKGLINGPHAFRIE